MQENNQTPLKAKRRSLTIKLCAAAVLLIVMIYIFTMAWFSYNRSVEVGGLDMQAVGREKVAGKVDGYYLGEDGSWKSLTTNSVGLLPGESMQVKLVLQNPSADEASYKIKIGEIDVLYYAVQPFNVETAKTLENWNVQRKYLNYNGEGAVEITSDGTEASLTHQPLLMDNLSPFRYALVGENSGEYISAGDYTSAGKTLDYHTITTADFLSFLKPASNAVKYGLTDISAVAAEDSELTYEKIVEKYNSSKDVTAEQKKAFTPLAETPNQDLSELNTGDFLPIIKDVVLTKAQAADSGSATLGEDGAVTLGANTTAVVYMTLYFDEEVYSQAELDGKEVTLENSDPFMYQLLRLSSIQLESEK